MKKEDMNSERQKGGVLGEKKEEGETMLLYIIISKNRRNDV